MNSHSMVRCVTLCVLFHVSTALCQEPTLRKLEEITVTAPEPVMAEIIPEEQISRKTSYVSDSAQLLQDIPGVSVYSAGGVSSLPVVHGLADDRLRIKVDGMDLISSCPNHMNSPLSYVDPTSIRILKVYTGISPVSLGGDSIGAVIIADTKGPAFGERGKGLLTTGEAGARYRSNGSSRGLNAAVNVAKQTLSVNYNVSAVDSDNYTAGDNFKATRQRGGLGMTSPSMKSAPQRIRQESRTRGCLPKRGSPVRDKTGIPEDPRRAVPESAHGHAR